MAVRALSRDQLALGRAILVAADALGMRPEGAAWLQADGGDGWSFLLVTSMFERIGARRAYLMLEQALSEMISDEEIRDFTILMATPNEPIAAGVRDAVQTTARAYSPQDARVRLNGHQMNAVVYRMAEELTDSQARSAKRRFNRLFKEVVPA